MVIAHVINNNVVSAYDENGHEVVLMGKGLGFQKKPGQEVKTDKVEKRFKLEDKAQMSNFLELTRDIPMNHLEVSLNIIEYAKGIMPKRLSSSIYLSLTDHINFALDRYEKGLMFENSLLNEVRSFYPTEFLIGKYGLHEIKKTTGIELPIDEAASIAMHFVNAEYNVGMSNTMSITTLIGEILDLVESELNIRLDDMGLYYSRFVTHLKFLSQRIFTNQLLDNNDEELVEIISRQYPREFEISGKIHNLIKEKYDQDITREEKGYLTLHIRRIQSEIEE